MNPKLVLADEPTASLDTQPHQGCPWGLARAVSGSWSWPSCSRPMIHEVDSVRRPGARTARRTALCEYLPDLAGSSRQSARLNIGGWLTDGAADAARNVRFIYAAHLCGRGSRSSRRLLRSSVSRSAWRCCSRQQIASTSLTRSVTQLNNQIVGEHPVPARREGPERLPRTATRRCAAGYPVFRSRCRCWSSRSNVIGARGRNGRWTCGIDPSLAHIGGPLLRRFSARQLAAQRAIALPAPLAQVIGSGPLEPDEDSDRRRASSERSLERACSRRDIGELFTALWRCAPDQLTQQRLAATEWQDIQRSSCASRSASSRTQGADEARATAGGGLKRES